MARFDRSREIPDYLREWQEKIESYARRSGLDTTATTGP